MTISNNLLSFPTKGDHVLFTTYWTVNNLWQLGEKLFHWRIAESASLCIHDDASKWQHFPRYWPFVRVTGEFPSQRLVVESFDAFFHLRLNKRLSKQSSWWLETPSRSLWCNCYVTEIPSAYYQLQSNPSYIACQWDENEIIYSSLYMTQDVTKTGMIFVAYLIELHNTFYKLPFISYVRVRYPDTASHPLTQSIKVRLIQRYGCSLTFEY